MPIELPNAIFGFASRYFICVRKYRRSFRYAVAVSGHSALFLFFFQASFELRDHFSGYTLIFDVRVPVREATALLAQLISASSRFYELD